MSLFAFFEIERLFMIHQYKLGGMNVVLDVCSGAVHVVNDVAYDIIAAYEGNDREAVLRPIKEKYVGTLVDGETVTEADVRGIREA